MPIYQYECGCGYRQEVYQGIKDEKIRVCPGCGGEISRLIGTGASGFFYNFKYKDKKGTPIWFPKDNKPYFDRALNRTFNTIEEKVRFMDEKNLIMDGSSDRVNKPLEAGDTRFERVK